MKKFMAVFALLLASALFFSTSTFTVKAATVGNFTVIGGTNYTYSDNVLTITGSEPVTITGLTTTYSDRIVVDSPNGANITLNNVDIDIRSVNSAAAFEIAESTKGTVTVTLEGKNTLKSGQKCAGLQKTSDECKLVIRGNADGLGENEFNLAAIGGRDAAGIGGGYNHAGKNIYIESGKINAVAQSQGAGIGGGCSDGTALEKTNGENIEIYGTAYVKADGYSGAGIGGGYIGSGYNIKIYGDAIVYSSNDSGTGAGIGGGARGNGENITIGGHAYVKATAATTGAGIGGGGGGMVGDSADKINEGINITIEGSAIVIANAFNGGAGIGGGQYGNGDIITIKDNADVTADGGSVGAGIGGGTGGQNNGGVKGNGSNITISGKAKVKAYSSSGAGIGGGQYGNGSIITINDEADITATATDYGAGIGGGYEGSADTITINNCKKIEAESKNHGAGIGGGSGGGSGGEGTNITISGGEVTATATNGGAGIGGGINRAGTNITINGGKVTATAFNGGAGIGGGNSGEGSKIYIYDAHVEATCTNFISAAIGGSSNIGSEIHIYTDKGETYVKAKTTGNGAGIGGGITSHGIDIKISGNAVVEAESNGGAGIGSGAYVNKDSSTDVTISDNADITATSTSGAGIGSGDGVNGFPINITINGNAKVTAQSTDGAGIGGGRTSGNGTTNVITINGGNIKATSEQSVGIGDTGAPMITISGGTVTTIGAIGLGSDIDIVSNNPDPDNTRSRAVVEIKGDSGSGPIVYANSIKSANHEDSKKEDAEDGYCGILFEGPEAAVTEADFMEGIVYGNGKTVDLSGRAEAYTLTAGKTLTVLKDVTFKTGNKFILNASTLHLNAGATLDKWYEMTKENGGEIQHEYSSPYEWYSEKKFGEYEWFQPASNTMNNETGVFLCDICGTAEPHTPQITGGWKQSATHHWHLGTCGLGPDCSISHNQIDKCSYMVDGGFNEQNLYEGKLDYGEHRYNDDPDEVKNGKLYFYCIDCSYEKSMDIPTIFLNKVGVDGENKAPLAGAEFGLYTNAGCTGDPYMTGTTAIENGKAVVSFSFVDGDTTKYIRRDTTYYIKEIKAPDGYKLSDKIFKVTVGADGKVTYGDDGSEEQPLCENIANDPDEPTPSEPTPSQPTPSEPTPSEPTPSEPTPSEPTPSEPTPDDNDKPNTGVGIGIAGLALLGGSLLVTSVTKGAQRKKK